MSKQLQFSRLAVGSRYPHIQSSQYQFIQSLMTSLSYAGEAFTKLSIGVGGEYRCLDIHKKARTPNGGSRCLESLQLPSQITPAVRTLLIEDTFDRVRPMLSQVRRGGPSCFLKLDSPYFGSGATRFSIRGDDPPAERLLLMREPVFHLVAGGARLAEDLLRPLTWIGHVRGTHWRSQVATAPFDA